VRAAANAITGRRQPITRAASQVASRRNIVSGWLNSLGMFLLRFAPRRLATWLAARVIG